MVNDPHSKILAQSRNPPPPHFSHETGPSSSIRKSLRGGESKMLHSPSHFAHDPIYSCSSSELDLQSFDIIPTHLRLIGITLPRFRCNSSSIPPHHLPVLRCHTSSIAPHRNHPLPPLLLLAMLPVFCIFPRVR